MHQYAKFMAQWLEHCAVNLHVSECEAILGTYVCGT